MDERKFTAILASALMALAACAGEAGSSSEPVDAPGSDADNPAAGTRPSGEPNLLTVEGRIEDGVECPVLRTPDGETYALSFRETELGAGDYVQVTGEMADASFCMQGQGTLIVQDASRIDPPARDRDPARAGGVRLTREYLAGSWVAKGIDADCAAPDFRIRATPAGTILNGDIGRHDDSALVILDQYPRIDLDEPMDDLPIESRGPDGLAIMRPANDAQYDPVTISSATIEGDGVVFVKCAD